MYDIDTTNIKKERKFFYPFFIAGLLFLIAMAWLYISQIIKLKSLDSSVMSIGVDIKSYVNDEGRNMYTAVYIYEVNGEIYECGSRYSSSVYPSNNNKNVYYDSKNPLNCMSEYSKSGNNILLICMLLPIVFIVMASVNINKVNKRLKIISELNKTGKLVKNLPYHLENSGKEVNEVPIQMPVIEYTLPNGDNVTLYGDARHDRKNRDKDGMVDLVIDENNPQNYFIDFEINRLSGNLPQDYFKENQASTNKIDNA